MQWRWNVQPSTIMQRSPCLDSTPTKIQMYSTLGRNVQFPTQLQATEIGAEVHVHGQWRQQGCGQWRQQGSAWLVRQGTSNTCDYYTVTFPTQTITSSCLPHMQGTKTSCTVVYRTPLSATSIWDNGSTKKQTLVHSTCLGRHSKRYTQI